MPTLSGLPVRLSQMPDRKIEAKSKAVTMALAVMFMSTPLVLVRD
jgi:hypothetical protein